MRDLPTSRLTPTIALRSSPAIGAPTITPGTQEGTWRAVSQVRQTAAPQALTGGGHGSLLPTVQVVERNAALTPPVCCSMPPVSGAACLVENADLLVPGFVIALPEAFLKLPPVPVRVESVALLTLSSTALSRGKKLSGWSLDAPKVSTLRLPRLTAPRILWGGDAVLSRIALTRLCREAPLDVPFALAFGAEERRLAEATQLPSGDVTLLGVYPGVPLLAVSRIGRGGRGPVPAPLAQAGGSARAFCAALDHAAGGPPSVFGKDTASGSLNVL